MKSIDTIRRENADRQNRMRQNRRERGLKKFELWLLPELKPVIDSFNSIMAELSPDLRNRIDANFFDQILCISIAELSFLCDEWLKLEKNEIAPFTEWYCQRQKHTLQTSTAENYREQQITT